MAGSKPKGKVSKSGKKGGSSSPSSPSPSGDSSKGIPSGTNIMGVSGVCFGVVLSALLLSRGFSNATRQSCTDGTCTEFHEEQSDAPISRGIRESLCQKGADPPRRLALDEPVTGKLWVIASTQAIDAYGVQRFERSMKVQNINIRKSALETRDVRAFIKTHSKEQDVIMILEETDDVIVAAEKVEILQKFRDARSSIVLGADYVCRKFCALDWPVANPRFGDATSVIGKGPALAKAFENIDDDKDWKVGLVKQYLNAVTRQELDIVLDSQSLIFQNLRGYSDEMSDGEFKMVFNFNENDDPRVQNSETGIFPAVIRGAGNRNLLNQVGNYVPLMFTPQSGCIHCKEIDNCALGFFKEDESSYPMVYHALFIDEALPLLRVVLKNILKLDYPKSRIMISIFIVQDVNAKAKEQEIKMWSNANNDILDTYASFNVATLVNAISTRRAAVEEAMESSCQYAFFQENAARISMPTVYQQLIKSGRDVVSPKISREGLLFSNFWGAASDDIDSQCSDAHSSCPGWAEQGECDNNPIWMDENCQLSCKKCQGRAGSSATFVGYKDSFDVYNLTTHREDSAYFSGLWDVPVAFYAVMFSRNALTVLQEELNARMVDDNVVLGRALGYIVSLHLAQLVRHRRFHVFLDNTVDFGTIIHSQSYNAKTVSPDLFVSKDNKEAWAELYLHENHEKYKDAKWLDGRCWDIYTFPMFSKEFCDELIDLAETNGQWSGGNSAYSDDRLSGGYEPVPTQDIHFKQLGFAKAWNDILMTYVAPVAESKWPGYYVEGKETLDFIVKYHPNGQTFLRPHHDASTWTMNVALNQGGVDYTGGGTHFLNQNCTIRDLTTGHGVIHPGRLTHHHEGLTIETGTRYILVTFVDQ